MNNLDASCRVAFVALMHDLGKFAERAAPDIPADRLDTDITNYCKWDKRNGRYFPTRKHAAYTAFFIDKIEQSAPDLIQKDTYPFSSRQNVEKVVNAELSKENLTDSVIKRKYAENITDSMANAAAMHHVPSTLLQWIVATADRVASGFERENFEAYNNDAGEACAGKNHYQARLWTLLEQVRLEKVSRPNAASDFKWCQPLKPLTPENLFPVRRDGYEPGNNEPAQQEYRALWDEFLGALEKIPASHRGQWPLWLDHLDTLWQIYTHAIPSSTFGKNKPEISLYDHSKATAAFAVALWRWHIAQEGLTEKEAVCRHRERADWDTEKFLLVQGDFFGIQDFIFSEGAETNRHAAKLLRGRSFQVSLFTELAALRVLEILELPSTSQIINAAGKFLIVAPNNEDTRQKIVSVRRELNEWFLHETSGLAGIGLAEKIASCKDFLEGRFEGLMTGLFADLECAKLKRFELTGNTQKVFKIEYPLGVCQYNNRLPADKPEGENRGSARLSRDQIEIGKALAHQGRLLIVRDGTDFRAGSITVLETPVFGYRLGFTQSESVTGKFGELAKNGQMRRCWDFSLPENLKAPLWHGYARRYINAYVPRFSALDKQTSDKYQEAEADDTDLHVPKTFNHLACEDRISDEQGKWIGQIALATLKGDVDNLGKIFQQGLAQNTFAKMASLSRQMNAFFAIWLPAFCQEKYPNTYTAFAGGDDFFLIGPWRSTQKLAAEMAEHFKQFVAENPEIHFSVGFAMTKPGHPIPALAEQAEDALERAKGYETNGVKKKNAVCLYGEIIPWAQWKKLAGLERAIHELEQDYDLSVGYVYRLLHLIDLATDKDKLKAAMWRSRFTYHTCRYVVDKLPKETRPIAHKRLAKLFGDDGIDQAKGRFRIPLFNFFYSKRV